MWSDGRRRPLERIEESLRVVRQLILLLEMMPGVVVVKGSDTVFLENLDRYELEDISTKIEQYGSRQEIFRENNASLEEDLRKAQMGLHVARVAAEQLPAFEGSFHDLGFRCVAGVCKKSVQPRIWMAVHRVTRGNAYVNFVDVAEDHEDEDEPKSGCCGKRRRSKAPVTDPLVVCSVFCQDGDLVARVERTFQSFGVEEYPWAMTLKDAQQSIEGLQEQLSIHDLAISKFHSMVLNELEDLIKTPYEDSSSLVEEWHRFLRAMKAVYGTLNCFVLRKDVLRTTCFWPGYQAEAIQEQITKCNEAYGSSGVLLLQHDKLPRIPPTFFRTVEFTEAFQVFVDTYGVGHYLEANPAYLTCVTFPFLFGIMYGDIGHGMFILLVGILSCAFTSKLRQSPSLEGLNTARFMVLLMGFFSVFAGFMYNDYFSLGLDMFGTRYRSEEFGELPGQFRDSTTDAHMFLPCQKTCKDAACADCPTFPYPFGFDPIWKGAENELLYLNSFKMKFSIVIAFVQMTVGTILKGANAAFFRDWLTMIFEVIPQIVFFVSMIGYMTFLIVFKWFQDPFGFHDQICDGTELPDTPCDMPNIITMMLDMMMLKNTETPVYSSQNTVQKILLLLVVLMVPLMLIPKPLILRAQHNKEQKALPPVEDDVEMAVEEPKELPADEEEEEFDFGELMIHQMIETIEFVLGAVSNTASYLRLWALSLAHQQLALVFFDQTIGGVLGGDMNGYLVGVVLFFLFAGFGAATTGVLLMMDSLECFLHALRLQWVEFQSKFYKGDGVAFSPLLLTDAIKAAEE